jgi:hypothetical protein
VLNSELNLIFNVGLSSAKYDKPITPLENHPEFVWVNAFWGTRIET